MKNEKNIFVQVDHHGMKFLAETKTNYLLPIADTKGMCILMNYIIRNGDIPNVDTNGWWNKEEFEDYFEEDEWGTEE